MKLLMLLAAIYLVFLPTSLPVLVPQASVIDWTSLKDDDQLKAYLAMDSKEQNELDLQNTVEYKPSLNSNNSNDSGNDHEAFQYARLYYLIFFQPYSVGNVSKWQKSHNHRAALGNTPDKDINRYESVADGVLSGENKKLLNRKTINPHWYVMHMPSNKKNATNGASNKKQYNGSTKRKSGPTDVIQPHPAGSVSGWQKSSYEEDAMGNTHIKGVNHYENATGDVVLEENIKELNNKPSYPWWHVRLVQNHKNSVIPIFKSLFANFFNDGGKNGEFNEDSKAPLKINFTINNPYMFGSNRKSSEATGVVQPEEKEHEAKYNKYSFYSYFGEYPEVITTQNIHGLKHEVSGETEKSSKQLQMKDTRENHPIKWKGEGYDNGAHSAYFIIPNFTDKQTRFSKQKRQVKTNKESEEREQGKSNGKLHDIRTERPLDNASKSSGNTIEKPSNNPSAVDSDLVKKLQNSPTRGKAPIEDTVSKISKQNGTLIFNPNLMTSAKFNSSMTPSKSLHAFPKSDSNNLGSFHPIQSNSNPKEAVNFDVGYQKDIKSMEEGKIIPENVPRSTTISAETAVGIKGNHSILEANITPVKYSDINDGKETHNRNGTTTKLIQKVVNSSFSDTKIGNKTFLNNTSQSSYRIERSLGEQPILITDLMEDMKAGTINDSCPNVNETVKPDEISHANNLSMEEQNGQDVMYRSHENVSDTLTSSAIQEFNISKVDTLDREKQIPHNQTMTEVTEGANTTTQKPVISTIVKNEEATYRMHDSHKFNDGIQTTTVKTEVLNENVTIPKTLFSLHHTDSTSGAEMKNIEAVAYRNNDDTKPLETITDETQVVNRSNGEVKEFKQTALNENLGSTSGAEVKNTEAVTYHNNDDTTPLQTITDEIQVVNTSNNSEIKESKQTTLNDNFGSTSGAEVKNTEAVAYRNNDDTKLLETVTDKIQVVNRSNNGEAKESNQTTLNDNLGRNSTGSHLMKKVTLDATKIEQSQTYENNTTTKLMTETETRLKPTDDPHHANIYTTNHGRKREILFLSKQLVGTNDNNNTETKISDQGMLDSSKLNATGGNLNETDGAKIKPQQGVVPEQIQAFDRFIFASKNVSRSRTKEPNAYMTTESVIDNQQENTPNKHMQTVNGITNMTGWFERKQMNTEKETSGMETVHPSKLNKTKDNPFNDKAATSNISKAISFEIRPQESTPNKHMQTLNRIANMTGLFERKQMNAEMEESGMEIVRPSKLNKSEDNPFNEKAVTSNNSKDATGFEIRPQESTPNKHMQTVNGITNMTGWFELKQMNAEKEASGMETVRPSNVNKTKDNPFNDRAATSNNSKDAISFKIRPQESTPNKHTQTVNRITNMAGWFERKQMNADKASGTETVRPSKLNKTEDNPFNDKAVISNNSKDAISFEIQPQESTPNKHTQTVNRITNMTGWFERKQMNAQKEASGTETVRPSKLNKTEDNPFNDKTVISNNSKDAISFEIRPQESTPNKHTQTVNRITNMTGWFKQKQMNTEKEASGMETVRPSQLNKTIDDPFNDKDATSNNSNDATSFEIRSKITTAHPRYTPQNSEKRADNTYEANPTVSDNSGVNVGTETDKFQLADRKETAVVKK